MLLHGPRVNGNRTKHGWSGSKIYLLFKAMHNRCYNPKVDRFRDYGARGITVCERWHSFENFLADMGVPPDGYSLDRIDNDEGYSPKNCRWANRKEQANNARSNKWLDLRGERKTISQWAETLGIPASRITARLALGWSAEDAVFLPLRKPGQYYRRTQWIAAHERDRGRGQAVHG